MSSVLHWKLKDYLESHNITPYRLMVESGVSGRTIYAITNGKHHAVQGKALNDILNALYRLTGVAPRIEDLLEFIPDQGQATHA
jgi:DNA-binding Xre family transcriptional regulator